MSTHLQRVSKHMSGGAGGGAERMFWRPMSEGAASVSIKSGDLRSALRSPKCKTDKMDGRQKTGSGLFPRGW